MGASILSEGRRRRKRIVMLAKGGSVGNVGKEACKERFRIPKP